MHILKGSNTDWTAARVHRIILVAACAIAVFVAESPTPASAQVLWKMATEYPESNISGVGLATFGKILSSKSHGSVTTSNAFDNELKVSSGEMLQAARDHRIDGGDAFAGALESSDSIFGLSSLPFVVQSVDTAKAVAARARPLYERALEARGLKLLYITIWPATGIWSEQALKTADDLRALSIRTYDNNSAQVMRTVGATAEYLPFNEAIAKVKEHKLNAILTSGDGGAGRKLWDDLHHFTPINYAIPISIAFVRQDSFESQRRLTSSLPRKRQGMVRSRPGKQKFQLRRLRSWTGPISSDSDGLTTGRPYELTERLLAHRVISLRCGIWSVSGQCGHRSSCRNQPRFICMHPRVADAVQRSPRDAKYRWVR